MRRANEFNGWDVCLRNSFLGVKSWFMVKGGREEDMRISLLVITPIPS